jgi:hypothetical protein
MSTRKGILLSRAALMVALLSAGSPAFAQFIQAGIKGGVPLTDYFDAINVPFNCCSGRQSYTSSTNRYTVGPTIEVSLPFHLAIELDALYKRYRFRGTTFGVDTISYAKTTANSWEFPLLLKYKLPTPFIHPFADVGISFHRLTGVKEVSNGFIVPLPTPFVSTTDTPEELDHRFNTGFVIGGGAEIHVPFIHISPEIRYTRWGNETFRSSDRDLTSSQNQVEFLVGLTF